MMTVAAAFMGLLPIMWSTSAGADVMKRIAAPMIGGLVTSFLLELLVYPAIYKLWKRPRGDRCRSVAAGGDGVSPAPAPWPRLRCGEFREGKTRCDLSASTRVASAREAPTSKTKRRSE